MHRYLWLSFLLASCASYPVREDLDKVGAVSLLGDQLVVDVSPRSLFKSDRRTLDVKDWSVDNAFRDLFKAGIVERKRDYVPFNLEPDALAKLANVRERRFEKTVGRQSQALMDSLFAEADRKGMKYFFLLTPPREHEHFPQHRGNFGAYCDGRDAAYLYFFFDFALYDVAARRKVFFYSVDPSVTEAMTFGECNVIANLRDPVHQLEDPMRKTMGLLVDALFEKMGWKKP
jgi:hypothetical protein